MGKFTDLDKTIFSVFDSSGWKNLNIPTFPGNFLGTAADRKYIRISVIAGEPSANIKSVAGVLNIDIFTPYGNGPADSTAIADYLDAYLVGKMLSGTYGKVQFLESFLMPMGSDRSDTSLSRDLYTIHFNYYGV